MNKIILGEKIETKIDDNIKINIEDKYENIKTITIDVIHNTDIIFSFHENQKLDININIPKNKNCNIIEFKDNGKYKVQYKYNLEKNSYLNITKINDAKKTKEMILFNLNGENAKVEYLLKTIAKKEEKYSLMVYHNQKNTVSNITNHGINILDGQITFDVSGFVPNGITGCTINQNNRIINLTDNKCEIKPNLFIDENDVIANHSAHIGKCSDEKMFYLRSRGINKKDAESLLIKGFLTSKLDQKDQIEKIINKYW
ncbi:MAG: SufD family Fe-S cluster assembly protein [Bacilli bacterium]|nr:SufD family Fe-S cluster assembly protein [Bacilli bacterium]